MCLPKLQSGAAWVLNHWRRTAIGESKRHLRDVEGSNRLNLE